MEIPSFIGKLKRADAEATANKTHRSSNPFWVIVQKEMGDHIRSWRYIILLAIIALTCLASLYTASQTIRDAVKQASDQQADISGLFLFLKLFTLADQDTGLPSFVTFVTFLGPLLGIALGFDAINSERSKGTLSRMMSQPIPRDYAINAKFVAALAVISVLFFALGFLVMGFGIFIFGIPPSFEEFWRIILFIVLTIIYVAFWLNLAILFSVAFRRAATSVLSGFAVWLFFTVFYNMLLGLVANATAPSKDSVQSVDTLMNHQSLIFFLTRLSPSQLFSDGTATLLTPSVRSLGPLTVKQVAGAVQSPLPLGQSVLLVWPQVTGLVAATVICFGISYLLFMRQEIRSR